jgi:hypothetical protein
MLLRGSEFGGGRGAGLRAVGLRLWLLIEQSVRQGGKIEKGDLCRRL